MGGWQVARRHKDGAPRLFSTVDVVPFILRQWVAPCTPQPRTRNPPMSSASCPRPTRAPGPPASLLSFPSLCSRDPVPFPAPYRTLCRLLSKRARRPHGHNTALAAPAQPSSLQRHPPSVLGATQPKNGPTDTWWRVRRGGGKRLGAGQRRHSRGPQSNTNKGSGRARTWYGTKAHRFHSVRQEVVAHSANATCRSCHGNTQPSPRFDVQRTPVAGPTPLSSPLSSPCRRLPR